MSTTQTYDEAGTVERLGGDRQLFQDLVRFFLEDSQEITAKLEERCAANDSTGTERAAHSLRGICSNFGAKEVVDLCWVVERRSLVEDWREVNGAMAQLRDAVIRLRSALQAKL